MTPVVNRLTERYQNQVDFRLLNAAVGEGKQAFEHYGLFGHPAYVILSPADDVIWQSFDPLPMETLVSAIDASLVNTR